MFSLYKKLMNISSSKINSNVVINPVLSKAVTHNFEINFCTQQYKGPKFLSKEHAYLNLLL
jgi:hypothetical protein